MKEYLLKLHILKSGNSRFDLTTKGVYTTFAAAMEDRPHTKAVLGSTLEDALAGKPFIAPVSASEFSSDITLPFFSAIFEREGDAGDIGKLIRIFQ